ncbi:MAG: ribonucleoside triphosphate reductase [Candidatus Hadarchaeum sp.]
MIAEVRKRDGRIVPFDRQRITNAIFKAAQAVGGRDRKIAERLTDEVVAILEQRFAGKIPSVEDIQDVVEKVLIEHGHAKTAKAYILYRKQKEELRKLKDAELSVVGLVDTYLNGLDWRIRENANINGQTIPGLIFHASNTVLANYALVKIYPPEVSDAHVNGDLHLHDLQMSLCGYCAGWSLEKLLLEGFNAPGRTHCNPPKHLDTALLQIVNFIGTLQNEWAGAQAFNQIDVLLAPFVRADRLSYREVRQALQTFVFNLNITSRWGGQCVSEDTEVLTSNGWKKFYELGKHDKIATFNVKNRRIEFLRPNRICVYQYDGYLIRLKNRIQDQLVTPNHRVVRKKFNSEVFVLEEAENLLNLKAPILVPISGYAESKKEIDDNLVKLVAWVVSRGSLDDGRGRVAIYQSSKDRENCEEIRNSLKALNLRWDESSKFSGFAKYPCIRFRLSRSSSRWIKQYVREKVTPQFIAELSPRQIKLYLDTYIKGDGSKKSRRSAKITPENEKNRDIIQALCAQCGYGTAVRKGKGEMITVVQHDTTCITKIEKVKYRGAVWCPSTKNGTFVARRNGKVFITGNSPFTNLTFALTCPEDLANKPAIVGGKPLDETYAEYAEETELINQAFLEVMAEGDPKGRVFTFPIPTYSITKDFPWDSELADKLFALTAKYGLPYFQNFINTDMRPSDVRSMCCRLRLDLRELRRNVTGGLFGSSDATGSVGVVTINMPRLGYLSRSEDEFFERLERLMHLAKESLEIKRKLCERNIQAGLLPFSRRYLGTLRNHFSTIGLVGMHEALLNMGFERGIVAEEGKGFAVRVLEFMRKKLSEFQEETGNLYNLEATPAEGTSYRLARIDRKKYPDIITAGEREHFYTNSTQLPVNSGLDLVEALEHQEDLQTLYTGGTVFHTWLGERTQISGAKLLLQRMANNTRLPYFTLTPTFSICQDHGYIAGEHRACPTCGGECEVYSRVVGYFRPVKSWNAGKQEEFRLRHNFDKS